MYVYQVLGISRNAAQVSFYHIIVHDSYAIESIPSIFQALYLNWVLTMRIWSDDHFFALVKKRIHPMHKMWKVLLSDHLTLYYTELCRFLMTSLLVTLLYPGEVRIERSYI
jgi:hypothetical protein